MLDTLTSAVDVQRLFSDPRIWKSLLRNEDTPAGAAASLGFRSLGVHLLGPLRVPACIHPGYLVLSLLPLTRWAALQLKLLGWTSLLGGVQHPSFQSERCELSAWQPSLVPLGSHMPVSTS